MSDPSVRASGESGPRPPVRPGGFAGGLVGRNLDAVGVSVVLLFGFGLLIAGLEIVRISPLWGFTYDGAVNGVLSQLAVTGPAAVLVAAAAAANVLVGAVVLRLLGAPAFRSLSDLALAGFTAAVVLDAGTLFLLGSVGLFGWPELLALHGAVAAAYWVTRVRRPLMAAPVRVRISRPAAWWLLVLAVWAGPLIIQLASPTVPFMDVLPNHVAPVEHIRVFGSFSTLTTSPSPIYGPSRLMLGYVAFLGQVTTITNLHAVLAEAAFALPLTVLVALAIRRLAGELFGGSASFWVLLTFPLTFTFMRLPDSRGTVVVFPIAAWALCTIAAEIRARARDSDRDRPGNGAGGAEAAGGHRSRRPDLSLAFAIGAGFLVHPLVGMVAATAAGGALILYPGSLARRLVPALGAGLVLAVPQVLTMGAIEVPAWVGAVFVIAAVVTAFGLAFLVGAIADRISDVAGPSYAAAPAAAAEQSAADGVRTAADWARAALVGFAIVAMLIVAGSHITAPGDPASEVTTDFARLVWLCIGGAALSALRLGRGWIVLGCGIVAGLAAWAASGLVGSANLTEQAVHYEVPKSVEYWLPVMFAIGAAGAIAAVSRLRRLGLLRPVAIGAFLVIAIYPITEPLATNVQIDEHRGAESVGLALREAELGYWENWPDSRTIVDAPRQAVVDELRAEEAAGRLGPDTRVLNIADSFQQWDSVPIGVFTGAIETSISESPELSIHTEGGRLFGFCTHAFQSKCTTDEFDQFDTQLASGWGYVVLEPGGLSALRIGATRSRISLAGYHQIWANSQATIYTR